MHIMTQRLPAGLALGVLLWAMQLWLPGGSLGDTGTRVDWVPDVLVMFPQGAQERPGDIRRAIVVEKATQRLSLYTHQEGRYHQVFNFACSTGKAPGGKQKSGDKKTPEGVYFFTKHHPRRELTAIYGSRAFPMDYPNALDRQQKRSGYAIWMHGTNKPLKARDSNGCIVLRNEDIDRLVPHIVLRQTPIIVVEKVSLAPAGWGTAVARQLWTFIGNHYGALQSGSQTVYEDAYGARASSFTWWPQWQALLQRAALQGLRPKINLDKGAVFRVGDVYVVTFREAVATQRGQAILGTKKLFVQDCGDHFEILTESYLLLKRKVDGETDIYPGIAALQELTGRGAHVDLKK